MRESIEFRMPPTVLYGRESFARVGEQATIYGKRALLISDRVMEKIGNIGRCIQLLQEAGLDCVAYLDVNTEPTDAHVTDALDLWQEAQSDVVIALGGGSCIDTAKAVAVLAGKKGYIGDYVGGKKRIDHVPVPLIALPTTAGTGSEATSVTVITSTQDDVKMMIKDPALIPTVAIVDPILTITSPPQVTAATGIDALCHAIEAFLSRVSQPMTDTLALSAIASISKNIRVVYQKGDDIDAREEMALASMQAGIAFSNASVCLVHGMSRPIGALFHVPHGLSNAMLLPAILEFSKDGCVERLAVVGRMMEPELELVSDQEAAKGAVQEIKKLCSDLDIPTMKRWGIEQTQFEQSVTKMATDALDSGSPQNNPKVPSHSEIMKLYHTCYDYQF